LSEYLSGDYPRGLARTWPQVAKRVVTGAMSPLERHRAGRLREAGPVRLHLGCADVYLDGWANLDMFDPRHRLDLRWDLRRDLPFPDATVRAIYAEHLFEHIDMAAGLKLLRECRRALAPDGVLRVTVPDLERYARSYLGDDPLIDDCRPNRPTRAVAFGEVFYHHGHRAMYDYETLALALRTAGFGSVSRSEYGQGHLDPSPDSPNRQAESLYVEAWP
jgi:predicted SAM-dependent methyltransferase